MMRIRNSRVFKTTRDAGVRRAAPVRGRYAVSYLALTHEARLKTRHLCNFSAFNRATGRRLVVFMTRAADSGFRGTIQKQLQVAHKNDRAAAPLSAARRALLPFPRPLANLADLPGRNLEEFEELLVFGRSRSFELHVEPVHVLVGQSSRAHDGNELIFGQHLESPEGLPGFE